MRWTSSVFVFVLLWTPALKLLLRRSAGAERLVALYLLFLGAGLGLRLGAVGPEAAHWNGIGHVLLSLACVWLLRFTRDVFRPTERWARWLEGIGIAGALAALPLLFLDGGLTDERASSVLAVNAFRVMASGWSCAEAIRYHRLMRRRAVLGLADAVLVDRFRLWSIWMAALVTPSALVLALRLYTRSVGEDLAFLLRLVPFIRGTMAVCMAVAAVTLALTFFPPRAYRRWLERA